MPSSTRRLLAATVTAACLVAAPGIVALSAPASAASEELSYNCQNATLGIFTATAVVDTDAPATLGTGITVPLTVSTTVVVPEAVVDALRGSGIASLDGTGTATGTVDGVSRQALLVVPLTAVPGAGNTMTLVGSGSAGDLSGGAVGSTIVLGAGDFSVTLKPYNDSGTPMTQQVVDCTLADGEPTLVDTVSVVQAATSTVVTVQATPIHYGDTPSVTATVSVPGLNTKPAGKIAYTYAGKTVTVDVNGGKAKPTSLVPALTMGTNTVTAVFTPTDPDLAPSESSTPFKVAKARSTITLTALYRPAKDKIVARGKVVSQFGTPVAGEVRYILRRNGVRIRAKTVDLNRFDVAKAQFRNITRHGTYVVVARYRGSTTLRLSIDRVVLEI
jgi:hypothetical protein